MRKFKLGRKNRASFCPKLYVRYIKKYGLVRVLVDV